MRDGLVLTLLHLRITYFASCKKSVKTIRRTEPEAFGICASFALLISNRACYIFYLLDIDLFGNGKTATKFCVDSKPFLGCSGLPD